MSDELLEFLGEYFVKHNLISKGWTFIEFVKEWQLGFIVLTK